MEFNRDHWDRYFISICDAVALNSKCKSRQLGAIIVRDKSIVSTGYNGPPRGVSHCEPCPRKEHGYTSGEGLDICRAGHAELNVIINAARLGVSTVGTILYLNWIIPCKECSIAIINAGVVEVVCASCTKYDQLGMELLSEAKVRIREAKKQEGLWETLANLEMK